MPELQLDLQPPSTRMTTSLQSGEDFTTLTSPPGPHTRPSNPSLTCTTSPIHQLAAESNTRPGPPASRCPHVRVHMVHNITPVPVHTTPRQAGGGVILAAVPNAESDGPLCTSILLCPLCFRVQVARIGYHPAALRSMSGGENRGHKQNKIITPYSAKSAKYPALLDTWLQLTNMGPSNDHVVLFRRFLLLKSVL